MFSAHNSIHAITATTSRKLVRIKRLIKACHFTHLKCSHCRRHEQHTGDDSVKCRTCGGKMSAHFCSICKHFTSWKKNPCYCEKCGICKIHQDKCFHCEVCNACLDKRLEGNHKYRPDCGHDECCICLRMHSVIVRNYHIHKRQTENFSNDYFLQFA